VTDVGGPMSGLVICRGLPGAGKSYWTRMRLQEAAETGRRGTVVRSNRGDYRRMMIDSEYIEPNDSLVENVVTAAQHSAINTLLQATVSVICDDTNLALSHVYLLCDLARELSAPFHIVDFPTPLQYCINRDARRRKYDQVGIEVIRRMYDTHLAPYGGQLPPIGGEHRGHVTTQRTESGVS
jgi:tRNA uridine 5-carbamoylmethylation protein Kti12